MSNLEHDNDASLADFTAGWRKVEESEHVTVTGAVIGLTNFGERPVQSTRLAEVLGRPVSEAEALARQWGWPGTRVEEGLIFVNPERAKSAPRRYAQIGDRQFGVTGCAGDIFLYAPLVRPSLLLEETCTTTGTPIRIVFTPSRVESVDPGGAVVSLPPPQVLDRTKGMSSSEQKQAQFVTQVFRAWKNVEDIDANL
jgi:hypothetical protein